MVTFMELISVVVTCYGKWLLRNLCVCLKIEHLFPLHKLQLLIGGTCLALTAPNKAVPKFKPHARSAPSSLPKHCKVPIEPKSSQWFVLHGRRKNTTDLFSPFCAKKSRLGSSEFYQSCESYFSCYLFKPIIIRSKGFEPYLTTR